MPVRVAQRLMERRVVVVRLYVRMAAVVVLLRVYMVVVVHVARVGTCGGGGIQCMWCGCWCDCVCMAAG